MPAHTAHRDRVQILRFDRRARDISGYALFSAGDVGAAHVMAHRLLDAGQFSLGHKYLGEWLRTHQGSGSQWIHLHFHMAVFELAVGDWQAAFHRFHTNILPVAATTEDALTDAPAVLWRLSLTAPVDVEFPWQPLRARALACLQQPSDPFVELHNLLALAGAGDLDSLDHWLESHRFSGGSRSKYILKDMAVALRAFAAEDYALAASAFEILVPQVLELGGSRAQCQLFELIRQESLRRAGSDVFVPAYAGAA